jgi:hypothetical protein
MMTTSCPVAADRMRRNWSLTLAPFLLGAAVLVASSPASADAAAAEALFQTAKGLMDKKNYAEACPKFEASYKMDPAIGTMLNLADCFEKQGRLARAWVAWGDARDQAKRESDKPRADLASRRQKELEPRVPKLTVHVTGSVDGLEVYRDDVRLEPASFDVPLPVDPGAHKVLVRKGSFVIDEQSVESKEKGTDEVTLDATKALPPVVTTPSDNTAAPVMVRKSKGMYAGGIVLATFGGIFVVGGVIALGAGAEGPGASVGLLGAAMMTGGIVMAVVGGKKVPKKDAMHRPELFIGPTSVMVRGTF